MIENIKPRQLIGRIKTNPSEEWKRMEGLTLIVIQFGQDCEQLTVIRPIDLEEMERFYQVSYENTMKDIISDDYDFCIWYLLGDDCELICNISMGDLEAIREVTKDDIAEHNKNLEQFKINHGVYEYQRKLEEDEKKDEIAIKAFKGEEKTSVKALMTHDGVMEVDAVIYKGFAIHNAIGDTDDSIYKNISVISGEFKGMKIASCSIAKCKELIDEIRCRTGNGEIRGSDIEDLRKLITRY